MEERITELERQLSTAKQETALLAEEATRTRTELVQLSGVVGSLIKFGPNHAETVGKYQELVSNL